MITQIAASLSGHLSISGLNNMVTWRIKQKQKLELKKDDTDPLLGATTRDDDVWTAVVLEPELVTAAAWK